MANNNGWIPTPPASTRPVRFEHWRHRTFYASACRFHLDVPLDMTGVILAASREAMHHGLRPISAGVMLATDAVYRGAVLIEIERESPSGHGVLRVDDAELLVRELPPRSVRLRPEVDELLRWSREVGHEVAGIYVQYEYPAASTSVRATQIFATLKGEGSMSEPA